MSSSLQIRLFMPAALALAAALAVSAPVAAFAQVDDYDADMRIQRLENQLRTLTGQNEELQYRNRQLEEQLRQLQSGAPAGSGPAQASGGRAGDAGGPVASSPSYPAVQAATPYGAPQGQPPLASQGSVPLEAVPAQDGGRRGDAFDPGRNPNAPGVPRALGGGQLPIAAQPPGAPLSLSHHNDPSAPSYDHASPPAVQGGGLTTLPPSQTPRDEFDLGIGYIQRKDYALAEETMRNFTAKYPSDALVADAQYWLGESLYQRQRYREAAESFLAVTTKYDKSGKAPDALLRLGQSLAALKEKEAACAAFGEVTRKYPRAASGVKQGVNREQKRIGC